jgi:hypothetical protein
VLRAIPASYRCGLARHGSTEDEGEHIMMKQLNRIIGIAGALAIVGASLVVLRDNDIDDGKMYARIAPPAQDALVQSIDLTHITSFRYLNEHTLEVADETGKNFKMELMLDCPGLKDAKDFSLVTDSYRNFDKFTAIGVNGNICTFKDFSPLPAGPLPTPAT